MKNGASDMEEIRNRRASYFRQEYFTDNTDKYTQCEFLLLYLQKFDSITPLEALTAFGCLRLSARIADLRAEGHIITTEIHKGKKNYAIYRLEDEGNDL